VVAGNSWKRSTSGFSEQSVNCEAFCAMINNILCRNIKIINIRNHLKTASTFKQFSASLHAIQGFFIAGLLYTGKKASMIGCQKINNKNFVPDQ
jgi:hypothetical protein